jgi:Ca2+-binding EF-hand superfamily protein
MLFLVAGLRAAEAATAAGAATPAPVNLTPQQAELLRRYDTNHDGRLDDEELAAAHADLLEAQTRAAVPAARLYLRLVRIFDRDGDGTLNSEEQATALAYLQEHNPVIYRRLLGRFDSNHDQKLDPAESAALFKTLAALSDRTKLPEK